MILLELALNGIRGVKQLIRLNLKPGLNLVQGNNGSGKTTVCDTLFALFSPIPPEPASGPRSPTRFDQGQAGFLIRLKDGGVYRLARDFTKKKSGLSQMGPDQRFNPITQDEMPILKFLTDQAGGLDAGGLEALFALRRSSMPSSRPPVHRAAPLPAFMGTGGISKPGDVRSSKEDRTQKKKRIEEIQTILAQAEQIGKLEDQAADLQARSAELKRRLRIYQEKSSERDRLQAQVQGLGTPWPPPENYEVLLDQYEQEQMSRTQQLQAVQEEMEVFRDRLDQMVSSPIFLNKFFLSGSVLVILSIILPLAVELAEGVQPFIFVPLLFGIGLMAFAAFQDFLRINQRKGLESKLRSLTKQRDSLETGFKARTAAVQELLRKANCTTPEAFRDRVRDYEGIVAQQEEVETEMQRILTGKSKEDLDQELSDLTGKIAQLESEIRSHADLPSDLYGLQEEMRRLERELSRSSAEPLQTSSPSPQPVLESPQPTQAVSSDLVLADPLRDLLSSHPVRSLLQARLDLLQTEVHRCLDRFPQTQALSVTFDEQLNPALSSKDGKPVSSDRLSSSLLDILYFSLFLAFSQALSDSHPFPLILDDPLGSLDPDNQRTALDILREIAQNRQVLLFSSQLYTGQAGDNVLRMP
jgi:energy-coupling factor transporter ATP-binding protein EcfA2